MWGWVLSPLYLLFSVRALNFQSFGEENMGVVGTWGCAGFDTYTMLLLLCVSFLERVLVRLVIVMLYPCGCLWGFKCEVRSPDNIFNLLWYFCSCLTRFHFHFHSLLAWSVYYLSSISSIQSSKVVSNLILLIHTHIVKTILKLLKHPSPSRKNYIIARCLEYSVSDIYSPAIFVFRTSEIFLVFDRWLIRALVYLERCCMRRRRCEVNAFTRGFGAGYWIVSYPIATQSIAVYPFSSHAISYSIQHP